MAVKPFNVMNLGNAGLFNPKEMGYKDSLDVIKDESVKIQKSFVKIGWYLKHIRDDKLYMEDGYANIYECAADQLGYSQSTVSRFINICEKFSKDKNSPELDDRYAGFDKSQMIEMLPLEQEELEKVTPEMTVKEIREIKEDRKKKSESLDRVDNVEEMVLPGQTCIEKDFPEYMPEMVGAGLTDLQEKNYATTHQEPEPDEEQAAHPVLPVLKNADQRKEWLVKYKEWGLWYRDGNIDVNYYKFDFEDGSRLVVAEYPQRHSYHSSEVYDEIFYHLIASNKVTKGEVYDEKYRHAPHCETELIEFLKNLQKKR